MENDSQVTLQGDPQQSSQFPSFGVLYSEIKQMSKYISKMETEIKTNRTASIQKYENLKKTINTYKR